MQEVSGRIRKRGRKAAAFTFLLGPPLGGAAVGLIWGVFLTILSIAATVGCIAGARKCPAAPEMIFGFFGVVLMPISCAMWSFFIAGVPAAVAATYVGFRVGITGRLGWAETVIVSIACLAFAPVVRYEILKGGSMNYQRAGLNTLLLLPWSLFAALTLRYLPGAGG